MKKAMNIVLKFICVFFVTFLFMTNTYAENLSVDAIVTNFNKSDKLDYLSSFGVESHAVNNTTTKAIDVYIGSTVNKSFTYKDGYIYYESHPAVFAANADDNNLAKMFLGTILNSAIEAAGYDNLTIKVPSSIDTTTTFDEYGFYEKIEKYSITGTSEPTEIYTTEYKLSLDKSKIDKLVAAFGVAKSDPNIEIVKGITPTLEVKETTENSVSITTKIPATTWATPDYVPMCKYYRATSETGIFEAINDGYFNCNATIRETGLNSNTTYYYKVILKDGTIASSAAAAKTLASGSASPEPGSGGSTGDEPGSGGSGGSSKNPDTGDFIPTTSIFMIISASLLTIKYTKKKLPIKI